MVFMKKVPTVYCLMGPTAAGKTDLAVEWVEHNRCDIISVDSALVYRGMDIGTAKPDAATLAKAPHRLIDILEPEQSYSAADFCRDATQEIENSLQQGRVPLLVGGTMLYFRALQQGLTKLPAASPDIRQALEAQLNAEGLDVLYQELSRVDPISASKIKPNDKQRIQRALEVYKITGTTLSELHLQGSEPPPYQFVNLAIVPEDRVVLHQRIEQRFHLMLAAGVIEEVEMLRQRENLHINLPAMRSVGYRQIWQYLDGEYSKTEMVNKAVAATRQLAKRQITWLRRWPACETFLTAEALRATNIVFEA